MKTKNRRFTPELRVGVARRIVEGESVLELSRELAIKRSVLYRWRDAYLESGEAGLKRPIGRPAGQPDKQPRGTPLDRARRRIGELERKLGRQALENDFLRRAFKRVEELRRARARSGATASTSRSDE
jgi:transposase